MDKPYPLIPFVTIVGILSYFLFPETGFWTALGLAYCAYIVIDFTKKLGNSLPIPETMLMIAAMQWILGPWIDYITPETHMIYRMYVPQDDYMGFVVPGLLAMHWGVFLFWKGNEDFDALAAHATSFTEKYPSFPYLLIVAGFAIPYIQSFLPSSIGFVLYLLANVKYIGAIYLLFSKKSNRWPVFIGIMTITLIGAIASSMFHDFLLWGILTFTFVCRELKLSFTAKIAALIIGSFFVITIQAVKPKVRKIAWSTGVSQGGELVLFYTLSVDEWRKGTIVNPTDQNDMNVRLNQGWIISKLMSWVPRHEPYAEGSTITEAINASFVPRFLSPNKAIAGGKKNFEKYTGHKLEGASMGISLAGEGYANFGRFGGILFMFGWGLFVGWFWKKIHEKSINYTTLLLWSPLVFQQVVKAETELLDVLNHFVKAAILVWLLLYFLRAQFRIHI